MGFAALVLEVCEKQPVHTVNDPQTVCCGSIWKQLHSYFCSLWTTHL